MSWNGDRVVSNVLNDYFLISIILVNLISWQKKLLPLILCIDLHPSAKTEILRWREGFSKTLREQRSRLYITSRFILMLIWWHDWRRTVLAPDFFFALPAIVLFFLSRLPAPANRLVVKLCIWTTMLKHESIFSFVPLIVCLLVYQFTQ